MNTLSLQGHRELLTEPADEKMPAKQIADHQTSIIEIHEYARLNKIGRQITEADRLLRHIEFELFMRNGGNPKDFKPPTDDNAALDFSTKELEAFANE